MTDIAHEEWVRDSVSVGRRLPGVQQVDANQFEYAFTTHPTILELHDDSYDLIASGRLPIPKQMAMA